MVLILQQVFSFLKQKTCRHGQMFFFYLFMFSERKPLWEVLVKTECYFLSEITFHSTLVSSLCFIVLRQAHLCLNGTT